MLPQCPEPLPSELLEPITVWAKTWLNSELRPFPSQASVSHWDRLVEAWAVDPTLPLYVRRFNDKYTRGSLVNHTTGREIIPTDNTPSHWVFHQAFQSNLISLDTLGNLILQDEIPVAMMLKKTERERAVKLCIGRKGLVNDKGWKLCHIEPVNVGRGDIAEFPIEMLIQQHIRFLSPNNMFVVPKVLSGLGEIPEVIDTLNSWTEK